MTRSSQDAFYAHLPRKRVGAGALITDGQGRILIVEPTYKPTWEIPGGIVEVGETAPGACARELREELGLEFVIGRLLVIEDQTDPGIRGDSLMFVYDGGLLTDPAGIRLDPAELKRFALVPQEELAMRTTPKLARRLGHAVAARAEGILVELENGLRRIHQEPGPGS